STPSTTAPSASSASQIRGSTRRRRSHHPPSTDRTVSVTARNVVIPEGGVDGMEDAHGATLAGMGDPPEPRPERPIGDRPTPPATRRQYIKSGVLLAITGISLYLLLPSLLSVLSSWPSLKHLDWPFAVLVLLFELASSLCVGHGGGRRRRCRRRTDRVDGTPDRNRPSAPHPRGPGHPRGCTGRPRSRDGRLPGWGGRGVARGNRGRPVHDGRSPRTGRRWVQSLVNLTVGRRRPVEGLPEELISDRNFIRTTLDRRWKSAILAAAGNTGFDSLAFAVRPAGGRGIPPAIARGARLRIRGTAGTDPLHAGWARLRGG